MNMQASELDALLEEAPLPHYTASGGPIRRSDRIAFTVWTIAILLVLAYSFLSYLLGWLI
jgi:hypothetical protein